MILCSLAFSVQNDSWCYKNAVTRELMSWLRGALLYSFVYVSYKEGYHRWKA